METQIAEYSPATAALAELRKKYAKAVFDTSTPAGMAKAIAARRELIEGRAAEELRNGNPLARICPLPKFPEVRHG